MRIACIVGTLVGAGGCAQLVGAEDPVAAFEVSDRITGHFTLAIDATSPTVELGIYRFDVFAEAHPDDRILAMSWFAYAAIGSEIVDEAGLYFETELDNELELNFELDQVLDVPASATPNGIAVRLIADWEGLFPALDGTTATTDGFCGEGSGTVSVPTDGTFTASFAAVKREDGQDPPEANQAFTDCADF